MDESRARDFWERALRDIADDGFFSPVQTAEPVEAEPRNGSSEPLGRRHPTNLELALMVVVVSVLLALVVVTVIVPALF